MLLFLYLISFCIGCSSGDDSDGSENQENEVQGTIRLAGDETSEFGTSLTVGSDAALHCGIR